MGASYAAGTSATPLLYKTIGNALADAFAAYGDCDAVVVRHQGVRLTYAELAERVARLASGFLALGLEPGDRIGIWSSNSIEWVVTQLASARAGLILVTINPAYNQAEAEYCLRKVGCRALVMAEGFRGHDYVRTMLDLVPEAGNTPSAALRSERLPQLERLILIGTPSHAGFMSLEQVAHGADEASDRVLNRLDAVLQPDQAINIQFTSGTTGSPKGATLTHHNILNNAYFSALRMGLVEGDRLCIPVPLYHCFGMVLGVLSCLAVGATMVFPGATFDAGETLRCVEEERCSGLHGVPTMLLAMLDHAAFATTRLDTLRTGIMAGAPCPAPLMRRVMGDMHMRDVTIGYGMTEVSPLAFQTTSTDTFDQRVETVGRVHHFVEAKVVDLEGRVVPRGECGEVLFRGYSRMLGYWDDADRNAEAIDIDGWMHSGDLATMDEDGYLRIVGRLKDMIIRGGENIYPREIEEALLAHPAVQDAHVFGVSDDYYGEVVCAWIRRRDDTLDEDGVKALCATSLARYKWPRHIRFVEDFPMTVTGKVQKFVMRKQMADLLKQKGAA
ncbi:AMP-binding protein [Sphingomonas sp.]|uniref:AMP-binding protein n=1 Tax=Sphingomonas sp. TaxID=28214 RepID=UPI0031DE005E